MSRPDISVIVVSWNTRELTLACLDSLRLAVDEPDTYEVIVVDNGSADGSAEALAQRDDARLIRNPDNRGFAAAVNQGHAAASGELTLLLNSDVRLRPGALSVLARFLRDRPEAAGVAPLYLNPDGTRQEHYHQLPTFATLVASSTVLGRIGALERRVARQHMAGEDFSRPRPVEQPSASCLLLRTSLLEPSGLLDERFAIFYNDVMLARSLAARGHRLWMTPEAVVTHELGASTKRLGATITRHHLAGLVRYGAHTQPRGRMALLRVLIGADWSIRRLLRRDGTLSPGDLALALRGDGGPLPGGPDLAAPARRLAPMP